MKKVTLSLDSSLKEIFTYEESRVQLLDHGGRTVVTVRCCLNNSMYSDRCRPYAVCHPAE